MGKAKHFVAVVGRGLEELLADELHEIGVRRIEPRRGAVLFQGKLADGYRAVLWSRLASRVLLRLGRGEVRNAGQLYDAAASIPWEDHIARERTLAVRFVGRSPEIRDERFGAMKTKDAIVDRLRASHGVRPDVDPKRPDVPLQVHLDHGTATFFLDLAGDPLHLRGGGGRAAGVAPLRETLAAALLRMAGWPARAAAGESFFDPFCGSGTILVEAASVLQRQAPALGRQRFGFLGWRGHEPELWDHLVGEARALVEPASVVAGRLAGGDIRARSVSGARANLARFGLADVIALSHGDVRGLHPPADSTPGLLLTNPPYGERLGDAERWLPLYRDLGDRLRHAFLGWHAAILVGNKSHAAALGLRPSARHPVYNGPIECRLLEIPIASTPPRGRPGWREA